MASWLAQGRLPWTSGEATAHCFSDCIGLLMQNLVQSSPQLFFWLCNPYSFCLKTKEYQLCQLCSCASQTLCAYVELNWFLPFMELTNESRFYQRQIQIQCATLYGLWFPGIRISSEEWIMPHVYGMDSNLWSRDLIIAEQELTKLGVVTLWMLITKLVSMLAFKSVASMLKLCLARYKLFHNLFK